MNKLRLIATEKALLDPGFRQIFTPRGQAPNALSQPSKLAKLRKGQKIQPQAVHTRRYPPSPWPAMHESALIRALVQRKIGRPATYALIPEALLARRYAVRDETGHLRPTPRGRAVCEFLVNHFPRLCAYESTAYMEQSLDEIARGQRTYVQVVGEFWRALDHEVKDGS